MLTILDNVNMFDDPISVIDGTRFNLENNCVSEMSSAFTDWKRVGK